jgi:hypothetical protein
MGIFAVCTGRESRRRDNFKKREHQIQINIEGNDITSKDISKAITPTTNNNSLNNSNVGYNNKWKIINKGIKRSNLKEILRTNTTNLISNIILVTNSTIKTHITTLPRTPVKEKRIKYEFNFVTPDIHMHKDENYFNCEEIPISKTPNEASFSLFITPEESENLNKISTFKYSDIIINKMNKKPTLASIKIDLQKLMKDDNTTNSKQKFSKTSLGKFTEQKKMIRSQLNRTPVLKYKSKIKKLIKDLNGVTTIKTEGASQMKNGFDDESGVLHELLDDIYCASHKNQECNSNKNNKKCINVCNSTIKKQNINKENINNINGNINMISSRKLLYKKKRIGQFKISTTPDARNSQQKKSLTNSILSSNLKSHNK